MKTPVKYKIAGLTVTALAGLLLPILGCSSKSQQSSVAKVELRIPRVTKPWKDALRLVGDAKILCSDFALIKDQVGQWHCIGTFGKDGNGTGNGYAESDGYALFHAVFGLCFCFFYLGFTGVYQAVGGTDVWGHS